MYYMTALVISVTVPVGRSQLPRSRGLSYPYSVQGMGYVPPHPTPPHPAILSANCAHPSPLSFPHRVEDFPPGGIFIIIPIPLPRPQSTKNVSPQPTNLDHPRQSNLTLQSSSILPLFPSNITPISPPHHPILHDPSLLPPRGRYP